MYLQIIVNKHSNTNDERRLFHGVTKQYVNPGSTIYSDKWAANGTLASEGYTHHTVNHSVEFRSSEGCCTNAIEGLWGLAKLRIKKIKGVLTCRLPVYLDEFMYNSLLNAAIQKDTSKMDTPYVIGFNEQIKLWIMRTYLIITIISDP